MLGGFPGSFGIVTEYTIQCIPDSECPHFEMFKRQWSLPALDAHHLTQIITHTQYIQQEQEKAGTRDLHVFLTVGISVSADIMDTLPDLPIVGHISDYRDVRPDPDIAKTTVDIRFVWIGLDSGKFTPKHYADLLEPFDRITTGLHTPTILEKTSKCILSSFLGTSMSTITNGAYSYQNPEGYRYMIVGNHSNEWLDLAAIGAMSTELVQRVRENRVFSFQLQFSHQSSQWCRNTGRNMLAWRDLRIECADWMYLGLPKLNKNRPIWSKSVALSPATPYIKSDRL